MTQIVESLFGVNPERYQQQKDAALQQEALAYAQLDPMQRAEAGIYAGARGLASGIGRMLGGEDPGMRRVTEQDQIIRSIDLNNPETYGPAAQRAYQLGHTELAQKIMLGADTAYQRQEVARQRAAGVQSRQQTQAAQQLIPRLMTPGQQSQMMVDAEGGSYMQEGQAAGIDQNTLRQLMATPAGRAELKSYIDTQEAMQGPTTTLAEGGTLVRQNRLTGEVIKVATGAAKPVTPPSLGSDFNRFAGGMFPGVSLSALTGAQIEAVNNRIDTEKTKNAQAGAAKLSVSMQEGFGKPFTDTITSNIKTGRAAFGTLNAIENMQVLLDEGVKTGFGQEAMLNLGKAGQLFNPDLNLRGLAGQEAFQAFSNSVILPEVKKLGVNPTDTDLKFIVTGSPSLSKTVEGNKLMLDTLALKLNREKDFGKFNNQWLAQNSALVKSDPILASTKLETDSDAYYQSSSLYGAAATNLRQRFNSIGVAATPGAANARSAAAGAGLIAPPPPPATPLATATPVRATAPAPIPAPIPAAPAAPAAPTPVRVIPSIDAGLTAPTTLFRAPAAKSAGGNRVTVPSSRQETVIYNSLDAARSANGDVDVKRGNKRVIIGNTNDDVSAVELVYEYIRENKLATKGK